MLYVTNGTVQDLPPNQAFEFWDSQLDWGRAFKLAKIQQSEKMGPDTAPRHEMDVHVLLEAIASDKWKSFTSRPAGQPKNWCRWAEFCRWFFDHGFDQRWYILDEIRRGEINRWYPPFASWKWGRSAHYCCDSDQTVDNTVFWDGHTFDKNYCRSDRKIPETFPTPEELAGMAAWGNLLGSIFGEDGAKQFMDSPPTHADRATAMRGSSAPEPVEIDSEPDEPTNWGPWILGGMAILTVGLFAFSIGESRD